MVTRFQRISEAGSIPGSLLGHGKMSRALESVDGRDSALNWSPVGIVAGEKRETDTGKTSSSLPMTTGQMETILRSGLDAASAPVFNECLVIRLAGAVDPAALDRSLARLALRHPLLRGVPDAAKSRWTIGVEIPRWEKLEADDEEAAARLIEARVACSLAPDGSPPLAFLCIAQANGGTTLAFLAHHSILDGWSATVFLRELADCYRSEIGGGATQLPEPDDIARFIQEEIVAEKKALANASMRAFWKSRCGHLPAVAWPRNHTVEDSAAGHVHLRLPPELVEAVRSSARARGRTDFTHWLGTHLLWLHWLRQEDDLILGIPLAAQAAKGHTRLIGHGTRFLPVRSRVMPGMTAREFLDALAVEVAEVIQHGELTAGAMTPWLDRDAILAGHSLLPSAFSVVPELEPADFGIAGRGDAFIPPRTHVAMPLVAWLQTRREGLELDLAYQRGVFNDFDMREWGKSWLIIASAIAENQDVLIHELPLSIAPPRSEETSEAATVPLVLSDEWTPTARRIAEIWSELLGKPIDSPAAEFFASGGHSLLALRFFSRWQRESGLNVPLATLLHFPVLGDLARELDRMGGTSVAESAPPASPAGLACLRSGGEASALLFLHAGDGGILFTRDIAKDLPACHAIYAIESPHLAGEFLPDSICVASIAERYCEIWQSCGVETPPVLVGYSFGGVVAWDMACRMAARGKTPALVVLIDTHNPEVPLRAFGLAKRIRVFWRQNRQLAAGPRVAAILRRAIQGTKNHFRIRSEVRRATADPSGDLRPVRLRELHEAAMSAYRPPDYAGPVALLKAASSGDKYELPADYHWGARARGIFTLLEVPGDHLGILEKENLTVLAARLGRLLASSLPYRA